MFRIWRINRGYARRLRQKAELAYRKDPEEERLRRLLPLVLEILPGQAGEGLLEVFEVGSYEGKPLRMLIDNTLGKTNWNVEDRQILDDVRRQLNGGRSICRGQEIR